jgi:alkyl hydroperoxide reductase subunit F
MLTKDIITALKGYTANMTRNVTFAVQTGDHDKRAELVSFLADFASVSDRLALEERDVGLMSPVSFRLEVDGAPNGIVFSGIPGGHEFNSLVLAVLQSSGTPLKLDDGVRSIITAIGEKLEFEVFVSLSCHNCPDVVQALNQFAILNDNIRVETIDGGLYPQLIADRNIQGVPTVYLNGELFANGKIDTAQLLQKLMDRYPALTETVPADAPGLPLQDITVIGGGPAGVAAAIYAARKGLRVTIVADRVGGQLKDTMGIENMISIPKTTGPELSNALVAHMNDYDITVKEHFRVERIDKGVTKTLTLSSGEKIETRVIIVATGAQWRELGVPGEKENIGNGVAYCPHCDGPFFKGKDVAVVGGGNSGIEAAIDLSGIVKSVTVLEFLPELKADRILVDQALSRSNISIRKNVVTRQIVANSGRVVGIEYEDRDTGELHTTMLSGVFVQIGLIPNSAFLKDVVELNRYGEVIVNDRCETSEPGIYGAGDVTTVPYKQIVISMGEGAKASLAAFDYLIKNF